MVESVHSGYHEALTAVVWTAPTQDIDSAADDEWISLSDEIDNSALYQFADWELELGSAIFVTDPSIVEFFIVPLLHASTYPDWVDNVTAEAPANEPYKVGEFVTSASTQAQRLALRKIELPPKFKVGLRNKTNVALAASGNTLKYRRWGWASA